MDALESELIETVAKLAAARRDRTAQLERFRKLARTSEEARVLEYEIEASKETIINLHRQRKQLRKELHRSRRLDRAKHRGIVAGVNTPGPY